MDCIQNSHKFNSLVFNFIQLDARCANSNGRLYKKEQCVDEAYFENVSIKINAEFAFVFGYLPVPSVLTAKSKNLAQSSRMSRPSISALIGSFPPFRRTFSSSKIISEPTTEVFDIITKTARFTSTNWNHPSFDHQRYI